jgi:NAD(P)H-flavin reductase
MGSNPAKSCLPSTLIANTALGGGIFRLDFAWSGPVPGAGQFFLIRPARSSSFLGRPISAAGFRRMKKAGEALRFLIIRRGRGTAELSTMRRGETAELIGPLGNRWSDFLPPPSGKDDPRKPVALMGGGIGIAPLLAFAGELARSGAAFDFYAGFRTGFQTEEEYSALLGPALRRAGGSFIAAEDGRGAYHGRIPELLEAAKYRAVYACGPEPMLKAVAARCRREEVPCFLSVERPMACGVGACLGCTVQTAGGNRRCCTDGPVFPAEELIFA